MSPWNHVPGALAEIEAELAPEYPTLHAVELDGHVRVRGSFPVRDGAQVLTWFQIDVALPPDFPRALPVVWETGGRIPRVAERHINSPGDGSACVVLPESFWLAQDEGEVSLLAFLRGPVHNYFLGQALVELGEPWPFGEWGHGVAGVREHYGQLLGTSAPARVMELLRYALSPAKGHWPCPCGQPRRLRSCHGELVRTLKERVPITIIRQGLRRLETETRGPVVPANQSL
ncbi:hypothetical protein K8640_41340 [Myxococcus sp. XM-1-1-1]|uniref:hypothetical protein n=1 Tax=Myxococcus sp. XM-1-1-1 TaxID=2874602 RepID=UPI001CBC8E38|nr:hypothetical protein [Myxococcus sp. XM-1-1-1]MBZ4414680.1 hypothetical protein [Myxococcus sp. XM-1-1-1]